MEMSQSAKGKSIKTVIVHYLVFFCICIISWIIILSVCSIALVESGILLPGNYVEQHMNQYREEILSNEKNSVNFNDQYILKELLPFNCTYSVYDKSGNYQYGSMLLPDVTAEQLFEEMNNVDELNGHKGHLTKIKGTDNIYILHYDYKMHLCFRSLDRLCPNLEVIELIIFIVGFIMILIFVSTFAGKKLTKKMHCLNCAIQNIQNQNLEFDYGVSGIIEIDEILNSIYQMSNELKDSMNRQWNIENDRNEQISALAHDFKTPMTIVKGNVDLLEETDLTEEQRIYMGYIAKGSQKMSQYLEQLLKFTRMQQYIVKKENVNTYEFLDRLKEQITGLVTAEGNVLEFDSGPLPETINIDSDLLQRAIMNIISNAISYSPEQSKIQFSCHRAESELEFIVTDCGPGFNEEEKKKAAELFFRGDQSRKNDTHYGMGLYIAKSAAEAHNGELLLGNSDISGGAKVSIIIPVN